MSDIKVLSKEEVDALLKITQDNNSDFTSLTGDEAKEGEQWAESTCSIDNRLLTKITELTMAECEKNLVSFLHKKISVKLKSRTMAKISESLAEKMDKHVFTVFKISPNDNYGMAFIDMMLLHQAINMVFGGQVNPTEQVMEAPGKIGIMIAEKMCQLCIDGFVTACTEFGAITYEIEKTIVLPNLTSKLNMEDNVYSVEMTVAFGDFESTVGLIMREDFLRVFIPIKSKEVSHVESNFWRSAIETQVVDSLVTVNVTLPDINMKMSELMALKSGDLIPISDPTLVYVCLNNLKLFRGNAGQANSKRVAKIVSEI